MFKKMLDKFSTPKPQERREPEMRPQDAALIRAIEERSKVDPMVGAKIGSKEVFDRLINGMKDEKGVHVESLLCALGALAGYACQASLRAQALAKGMGETAALMTVDTKDGRKYFFGDPLNNALAGAQYSVWALAGGAAQEAGAKDLPDLNEIFEHTAAVVGSEQFGIPRLPSGHKAGDLPANYLKALWPAFLPMIKRVCPNPGHWPILYGLAIQHAIDAGKGTINPSLAMTIVMESAVPMSKVDLASL